MSSQRWVRLGRRPRPVAWVILAALLASCSGGGGGSPTAPERQGALNVAATILAVTRTGFLEVSVLLDGERIGHFVSGFPDGVAAVAPITGTRANVRRGAHTVEFRFDRMTTGSATVQVDAVAFFVPGDGGQEELIAMGIRRERVERGGRIRYQLSL